MRNLRNQRGAALLETAVTLPLILLVSVGHLRVRPGVPDVAGAHQCRPRGRARRRARRQDRCGRVRHGASYMTSGKLIGTPSIVT